MTRDDDEYERKFAPRTLPEQVAEELGAEIIAGSRKSGERLIEIELAQSFGVSRGPIREAIRILERRRLVDFNPRRGAYVRPLSLKSIADLFDVRIALSLLAVRSMATAPVESYIETLARRCAELDAMVDAGDPIAFARVTTRAVRTVAHGSGNELLAEQLADLANQTVWATIWKAPLDYQTPDIRRETADLMRSTLDAIRRRDVGAAITSQRKLLEDDRRRALASLSRIMAAAVDFGAFTLKDTGKSGLVASSAA